MEKIIDAMFVFIFGLLGLLAIVAAVRMIQDVPRYRPMTPCGYYVNVGSTPPTLLLPLKD